MSKQVAAVKVDKVLSELIGLVKTETINSEPPQRWPLLRLPRLSRALGGGIPRKRVVEIHGPSDAGKSLAWDEPVLTPRGWAPIGALKVGDEVLDETGYVTRVSGVFPQGELPVYRISFDDGTYSRCSANHLWKYRDRASKSLSEKWRVATIAELLERYENTALGMRRLAVPTAVPEFDKAPLPLDPYLLGVLLGNGCFTERTPSVSMGDTEIRDAVVGIVRTYGCALSAQGATGFRISERHPRTGNRVTAAIRDMGLWGHESHQKFVPPMYMIAAPEDRHAILQGLLDTDGTVDARYGRVSYSSASPRLAADVADLVRSLGGHASPYVKENVFFTYKGTRRRGMPAHVVHIRLPAWFPPFRLPRKALRVKVPVNTHDRYMVDVAPDGVAPCVCIKVDSPFHTFVTRGYMVTHNSTLVGEFIRAVVDAEPEELCKPEGRRISVMDHEGVMDLQYMETITGVAWGHVTRMQDLVEVWRNHAVVYFAPPYFEFDALVTSYLLLRNRLFMSCHDSIANMVPRSSIERVKDGVSKPVYGLEDKGMPEMAAKLSAWLPRWSRAARTGNACVLWTNHAKRKTIGNIGSSFLPAPWYTLRGDAPIFNADIRLRVTGAKSKVHEAGKKSTIAVIRNKTSSLPGARNSRLIGHITGVDGYDAAYEWWKIAIDGGVLTPAVDGKKIVSVAKASAFIDQAGEAWAPDAAREAVMPGGALNDACAVALQTIALADENEDE